MSYPAASSGVLNRNLFSMRRKRRGTNPEEIRGKLPLDQKQPRAYPLPRGSFKETYQSARAPVRGEANIHWPSPLNYPT